jgi:hypothetical protein
MWRVRRLVISRIGSIAKSVLVWFILILIPVGIVFGLFRFCERDTLSKKYQRALRDAFEPDYSEVYHHLTQISSTNNNLIWNNDSTRLLVATWTRFPQSFTGSNNDSLLTFWGETWVTVVPELHDFCKKLHLTDEDLILRLEQLHGLPSHNWRTADGSEIKSLTHIVEMWVRPDDLFRPCLDAQISDSECFVKVTDSSLVTPEQQKWIDDQIEARFNREGLKTKDFLCRINGHPFTRLGYTYDWGNPDTEIGLSEFVLDSGVVVNVQSVKTTREYCR